MGEVVDGKDVSKLRLPTKKCGFLHGFLQVMGDVEGRWKDGGIIEGRRHD